MAWNSELRLPELAFKLANSYTTPQTSAYARRTRIRRAHCQSIQRRGKKYGPPAFGMSWSAATYKNAPMFSPFTYHHPTSKRGPYKRMMDDGRLTWINTNAALLWTMGEISADSVEGNQLDYGRIPTNIAPSFEPFVPQAHPSRYNSPPDSRQMNESYGVPLASQAQSMPPIPPAGPSETSYFSPYDCHPPPQSLLGRPLVPSQVPPHLLSPPSSIVPQNMPQPYQSRQETFPPPLPDASRSPSNRPTTYFVYKCEWVSIDGQFCDMHFASDQNSIFRHLEERHQVSRVGTSLCRWGSCRVPYALRHDTIARHVMRHVDIRWACSSCPFTATRRDNVKKHVDGNKTRCPGAHVKEVRGPNGLILDVSPFAKGQ
ncbi:hypothetical protein BJ138DRAFT_1119967 [Hygrophoropsis aurantiaca]|uniref:Uncharacterized protein n=1 Tax=Hygrophoropsis aurantiaca TaxID=72124 RepID=A0ACB7ZRV9_9AGAM|nr:hypothetical protein BJ138DRAFT_1119967 [Hygrophoropsis aurantiaca]